jgi:hypothetical protein
VAKPVMKIGESEILDVKNSVFPVHL